MFKLKYYLILFTILFLLISCAETEFVNPLDPDAENYNPAPESAIISPESGSIFRLGDTVEFIGSGDDIEEGALTGNSLAWSSDFDGLLGYGDTLNISDLSANNHYITLTVTDAGNRPDTSKIFIYVTDGNVRPEAEILTPEDNLIFFSGDTVDFIGTASDFEDGELTGNYLKWTSDIDGVLGYGDTLKVYSLSYGTHDISLIATDFEALTDTASIEVTFSAANGYPVAVIVSPQNGETFTLGESITFTGVASDNQDGELSSGNLNWYSDLDGFLGSGNSVTVSDLRLGDHTILFTAEDSDKNEHTVSINITIDPPNQPPVALITSPKNLDVFNTGQQITFIGSGLDPEDGTLSGASLVWISDQDDEIGTGIIFSTSSLSDNIHNITLTVTDSEGLTDSYSIQIEVRPSNTSPTASFVILPAEGEADTTFTFDASGSTDYETPLELTYNWDWESDGTFDTGALSDPETTHMFPDTGYFEISLIVTDPGGLADTVSDSLHVLPVDTTTSKVSASLKTGSSFSSSVNRK
ncbi:PKD domain-containing protein [candidate division KSB1 bacterium]